MALKKKPVTGMKDVMPAEMEIRAKSDVAYAKGAYEKEMEQAALLAEAKIHI